MGMFDWLFGKKEDTTPRCVVCDNLDVEVLGPDAYRCSCGYEGGDGYADYQRSLRKEGFRSQSIEELQARVLEVLEEGRFRLSSVAEIPNFSRGGAWGNVQISFQRTSSVGRMMAQQDEEEAERRRVERDVAGTFVHQQVLEAVSIVEILIEKGEAHLALALEASRTSSPRIENSGTALLEMGKLIVG